MFDLGKVLVGFDYTRGYRALEPHCRFPASEIPARINAAGLVLPFERGEVSNQAFFEGLSAALGLEVSYDRFCELWSEIFLPEPLLADELLAGLHSRYRLVLISNTNDIHFRMIERTYPLLRHFEARALSYQVGAMKPAAAMYQEAVRLAGCPPEQCLYIDDVREFVEAGRRHGLDAVQFQGESRLVEELRKRGIL